MVNSMTVTTKVLSSVRKLGRLRSIFRKMELQKVLVGIIIILVCACSSGVSSSVVHVHADSDSRGGFWRKKVVWKARLVKDWQLRKIIVPVWKTVWGPIEMKEWIPFPKQPSLAWKGVSKY